MSYRVMFQDREFWFRDSGGAGPLAPLEHCNEDGSLKLAHALSSISFAHVYSDGTIRRYGEIIGHRADLRRLNEIDG
jgi:hypothetical protein